MAQKKKVFSALLRLVMIKDLIVGGEDGRHVLTANSTKKKASFSSRQLNQHDI
jgi:hypothetical protein